MGRPPKSRDHITNRQEHYGFDARKTKHRDADTKYRSKVQFLYGKMRQLVKVESTKDGLLTDALKYIQRKEKDLCKMIGSENMKQCKKEFVRFLMHEEAMWKKEKDLTKWWSKVEDALDKDYTYQGSICPEAGGYNEMHSDHNLDESLYMPADINLYLENPNNAHSFETKNKNHVEEKSTGNPSESFSYNEVAQYYPSEENLNDVVYMPNNFWSPIECTDYIQEVPKGDLISYGEIANVPLPSKDNQLYSVENPLILSNSHISIDNSVFENPAFSSATFLYF